MGLGDNLLATGMARGAKARGKRIAFGDGEKIIWDQHSEFIFRNNPNIALPIHDTTEPDIEWVPFYKGNRLYNSHDRALDRWVWNYDFKPIPGELFFSDHELAFAHTINPGFVLIEPQVQAWKTSAPNKTWPLVRYEKVARRLSQAGYEVRQFTYPGTRPLRCAKPIRAKDFRHAIAALSRAALYIGPEGGLHHGAAAVRIPGVVIFGGFIPPQVTGYDFHTNLTGGATACGSLHKCDHCRAAMESIKASEVVDHAIAHLKARQAA